MRADSSIAGNDWVRNIIGHKFVFDIEQLHPGNDAIELEHDETADIAT